MTWQPDICIYHFPCDDGFGSAWAVWKRWGGAVEYAPCNYGQEPPGVAGKNVLIADFSFKPDVLQAMARTAASVVVLDHHKTAEADLRPWQCSWFDHTGVDSLLATLDVRGEPSLLAHFDMDQSGAMLTWKFCHPDSEAPLLMSMIEDRDLWRFRLDDTRRFSLYLRSLPYAFDVWDTVADDLEDPALRARLLIEARGIERFYNRKIGEIVVTATFRTIGGFEGVPVAHAPYAFASDVANALLTEHPDAPFAAVAVDAHGGRTWSLRSEAHRVDVSEVARSYGGGGHRNAAGFRTPV